MNPGEKIRKTAAFVREELYADTSGHDWWHIERVRRLALVIGMHEGADLYVVELAALLHDISDYKLNGGDLEKGPQVAFDWVVLLGESEEFAGVIATIVGGVTFKGAGVDSSIGTLEGMVVQDADRLDAIGAVGVARAFTYGGSAGQPMHEPGSTPTLHATTAEYLKRSGTTVDHFYEKLLLLRDRMNTATGRGIAERRHAYLESFLEEFLREWDGRDLGAEAQPGRAS